MLTRKSNDVDLGFMCLQSIRLNVLFFLKKFMELIIVDLAVEMLGFLSTNSSLVKELVLKRVSDNPNVNYNDIILQFREQYGVLFSYYFTMSGQVKRFMMVIY